MYLNSLVCPEESALSLRSINPLGNKPLPLRKAGPLVQNCKKTLFGEHTYANFCIKAVVLRIKGHSMPDSCLHSFISFQQVILYLWFSSKLRNNLSFKREHFFFSKLSTSCNSRFYNLMFEIRNSTLRDKLELKDKFSFAERRSFADRRSVDQRYYRVFVSMCIFVA